MKAKSGDKIKAIKECCYGSAYGLIEIENNTIFTVKNRNESDDGVATHETITLNNGLGEVTYNYNIWDHQYVIIE